MRFSKTLEHVQAHAAWEAAYAAYDRLADAGDECSPEAEAASQAEYAALDNLMLLPSVTPHELSDKLDLLLGEREYPLHGGDIFEQIKVRIKADLFAMSRPAASPEMAEAFAGFMQVRNAFDQAAISDAADADQLCHASAASQKTLMGLSCYTAGDILVKVYVELLGLYGSTAHHPDGSSSFIDEAAALEGREDGADYLEYHFADSQLRDLKDTDLGLCMMLLGRVDFDPAAYVQAMIDVGVPPTVTLDLHAGKRQLGQSLCGEKDGCEERFRLLPFLLGARGEPDRGRRVADEIEANYPDLISRYSSPVVSA